MIKMFMCARGGKPAPKQKVYLTNKGRYLESYGQIVAYKAANNRIYVTGGYNYSTTTLHYVVEFLGMRLSRIQNGIEKGYIHKLDKLIVS